MKHFILTILTVCSSTMMILAQRPLTFWLTTPSQYLMKKNIGSAQITVEPIIWTDFVGITLGGAFKSTHQDLKNYKENTGIVSGFTDLRFYAFRLGEKFQINSGCENVFAKKEPFFFQLMKGFYIAPGYEYRRQTITLLPEKIDHTSPTNDPIIFYAKKNGFRAHFGVQISLLRYFAVDIGYGWIAGRNHITGPFNLLPDDAIYIYENSNSFKINKGPTVNIGVTF